MKSTKLTLSLIATYAITQTPALAESNASSLELDPIVVSDFRAKSLSETSNTVSVVGSENIYDKASENFENVIGQTPNVNFSSGASRAHHIQIRGIGERSQFQTPINPSVGIMVDGVDMSQSALGITMFDVNQIEVHKGPQGTTYGANGLAGVVNVQSNEPSKETEIHVEGTVGNYNTKALGAALGGTLVEDKLIGRISVYKNSSDGFMENSHLNREDTQNIDELSTKAQLRWFATDEHTIDLNLMHLDIDNGYDAFTFDNSRNSHADQPGTDSQKTDAFAIKATSIISPKMHLESRLSYSKSDMEYSYDEDWSYVGAFADELWPYSSFDQYLREREQTDMDVRLVSDEAGKIFGGSTAWTVGVYAKQFNEDLTRNYTYLEAPFSSEYRTQNKALYGQLESSLSDKLTLITGLRVEKWDSEYSDSDAVAINTHEVLNGGKLGLNYQHNANTLFYSTLSKGYKPGGVNADNTLAANAREYETETLWNLDLGVNSNHYDNKLTSRLNLFYGKRRDQQVKSSVVQVREDGSTDFTDYWANAAKTHYYGVESELDYYPNNTLRLFTNVGILKAEFDEYSDPNPASLNVNGRAPAQSPEYQYSVGGDMMLTDSLTLKANVEGKGGYYFSNRHNAKSDAYKLINSSLEYTNDNWTATLWGRNLADADYQVRGFGSFGNNPGNGYITETYTQQGNPRTFGLTVGYDY
ncbi:MAG: TonB-dependent receptor [Epsilonproteobacteria bacterium]|nr:TonB-dependent receptor [Campylobacterota bacterium]